MTKGLKFAPVGMLLCALAVLFLKQGAGAPGWVFDWHVQLAYLPWLALLLCAGAVSYVLAARCKLDCVPLALAYVLLAVGLAEIARLKPDLFGAQLRSASCSGELSFFFGSACDACSTIRMCSGLQRHLCCSCR